MLPVAKILLFLGAAILGGLVISIPKGQNSGTQVCVDNNSGERQLREAAQRALNAINSTRRPSASYKRAARGQHVFNNGLLGFHRSVLQALLREVGGYDEQLENQMQYLIPPLNRNVQHAISTMVARFR
ncbi:hypothetical protein QQF64_026087 [Cirrhinus molitorella]|uniref:Uncharacterized protein n=1 Tax=Cirrhinus molitorella TaxID=172907 RepID=A0ABR3NR64_9TELE